MPALTPPKLATGRLDLHRCLLHRADRAVRLTRKELELLLYLSAREAQVVSREELLREVWGYGPQVHTRTLDATIARLRSKIEPRLSAPTHIVTLPGEGYRFHSAAPAAHAPIGPVRTSFVGREAELARLNDALREPGGRLAIVGQAGLGKTRLALRWAFQQAPDGRHLVCDLASARTDAQLLQLMEDALGLPEGPSSRRSARIGDALASRALTLLVLDNADAIPAEVDARSASWLATARTLRVLITSRAALPTARCFDLGPLPPDDAALLFRQRAGDALSDPDPASVLQLVQRLDGLPLAIEMAAARAPLLTPRQMLDHLNHRFQLLRFPTDPSSARARTLVEAIRWSWDLLEGMDQRALAALSVFGGTFDTPAAADLLGAVDVPEPLDRLRALERAGLLQVIEGDGGRRLRLWENLRSFARDALAQAGEEHRCARALLAWCLRRVAINNARRSAGQLTATDDFALQEAHNLRAAMRSGLVHSPQDATRLLLSLLEDPAWRRAETAAWLERPEPPDTPAHLRALLLMFRGEAHFQMGRMESAAALLGEALDLARDLGDDATTGRVLVHRATLLTRQGDFEAAERHLNQAEPLLTRAAPTMLNRISDRRALLAYYQGRFDDVLRWHQVSLTHNQRHGLEYFEMATRGNLASYFIDVARYVDAEPHARRALAFFERIGDPRRIAGTRHLLALLALKQGQLSQGEALLDAAGEAYRHTGDLRGDSLVLLARSTLFLATRGPEEALPLAQEARARFLSLHEVYFAASAAAHIAAIEAELGHVEEAAGLLESIRQTPARLLWDDSPLRIADCWIAMGRGAEALAEAARGLAALRALPPSRRPVTWILDRIEARLGQLTAATRAPRRRPEA
ncbi:MAG: winged helix-turn-helix domain-containing protein [Alphaproteobacteria bacterium]|nr:winged helix-turn-helix domain-containing protein [Alphaproteobacteria bacterium]